MCTFGAEKLADSAILAARFMLVLLFLIFGWDKLTGFSGTIGYMASSGLPVPALAAVIATFMELGVGLALLAGIFTRPLALLLLVYTFATALVGHHYWTMSGMEQFEAEINFYKNISIMGGLLLLYVTGAGKYALDRVFKLD
jgi:putative oxidoreductase